MASTEADLEKECHQEEVMKDDDLDQYSIEGYNDKYQVPEINKRQLARLEVMVCGNEGTEGNDKQKELRKFFHITIDQIQKEKPEVWKNAKVDIQDMYGQSITITAGEGKFIFTVQHDSKGEIQVYKSGRNWLSILNCFPLLFRTKSPPAIEDRRT